jgi:ATP-dependent exoDNAse (exonuclease V) alpha subunit
VGFVLARAARDGHTVWPAAEVKLDLELYRIPDPDQAIADACAGETVQDVAPAGNDEPMLALARYAAAEAGIADSVHRLARTATPLAAPARKGRRSKKSSDDDPDSLDEVQRSAVGNALAYGVSVLTGGPGTGKSRTVATLVREAARLATAVRAGQLPAVDSEDREVVIVPARGSADCAHRVVQLMTDSIPRALGIETDQIQVVTPVHRGAAGTIERNAALKARLNPSPFGKSGGRFDPGDRVVATANHLEATPTGFANGEVGTVTAVRDRVVTIDFGTTAPALAEVSGKMLADISHGWAITVHRAQGSEFRGVIVVLPPEAGRMLSRPLVYTALTRARAHLSVVHGSGPALVRAVRDIGATPRRTMLAAALGDRAD